MASILEEKNYNQDKTQDSLIPIIKIKDLSKHFPVQRGFWSKTVAHIHALTKVNLDIYKGEIIGIVGESGCGKSTLGKLILRLIEPTSGEVYYNNTNIFSLQNNNLRTLRKKLQIVFQNPYSSLNPRMKIKDIIAEPITVHKTIKGKVNINGRVSKLLYLVGLEEEFKEKYPHELSGGQKQRVAIARVLSLNPEVVILDEPVSALDVSIQAQILNLLLELHKNLNLTYLFISHDLSVVSYISSRIAVMYLGHIVELGNKDEIIKKPQHPYTKILLSAVPKIYKDITYQEKIILEGEVPDPSRIPSGCVFRTRCPIAKDKCTLEKPSLVTINSHKVACHYPGEF